MVFTDSSMQSTDSEFNQILRRFRRTK